MWMHSEWSMNDGMNGKQSERKKNDAMHEIECIIRVCNKTGTSTAQAPFTVHILHAPEGIQYAMNCFIAWRWCKNCNLLKFWKRSEKKRESEHINAMCALFEENEATISRCKQKGKHTSPKKNKKFIYETFYYDMKCIVCTVHTIINSTCMIKSERKGERDNNRENSQQQPQQRQHQQ